MCDSGDYWRNIFRNQLVNELGRSSIPIEKAVFIPKEGSCSRVLGLSVGDTIGCGDEEFYTLTNASERCFEFKPKSFLKYEFAGVCVEKTEDGYLANQTSYAMTIRQLS